MLPSNPTGQLSVSHTPLLPLTPLVARQHPTNVHVYTCTCTCTYMQVCCRTVFVYYRHVCRRGGSNEFFFGDISAYQVLYIHVHVYMSIHVYTLYSVHRLCKHTCTFYVQHVCMYVCIHTCMCVCRCMLWSISSGVLV